MVSTRSQEMAAGILPPAKYSTCTCSARETASAIRGISVHLACANKRTTHIRTTATDRRTQDYTLHNC